MEEINNVNPAPICPMATPEECRKVLDFIADDSKAFHEMACALHNIWDGTIPPEDIHKLFYNLLDTLTEREERHAIERRYQDYTRDR